MANTRYHDTEDEQCRCDLANVCLRMLSATKALATGKHSHGGQAYIELTKKALVEVIDTLKDIDADFSSAAIEASQAANFFGTMVGLSITVESAAELSNKLCENLHDTTHPVVGSILIQVATSIGLGMALSDMQGPSSVMAMADPQVDPTLLN